MPLPNRQISSASSACASEMSELSMASSGYFDDDDDEPVAVARQTSDVVLEAADLVQQQEAEIVKVSELFDCPKTAASVLLRKYNWNTERLIERFMDDSVKVLADAGLDVEALKPARQGSAATAKCGVCFDDIPFGESSGCSGPEAHRFCNECWAGYLTSQIGDGGALSIKCMQPQCPALVEPAFVQALVEAPVFAKFVRFAQRQFVDENPYIKFCPAEKCTKAIKVGTLGKSSVACACGFVFCFRCAREVHWPMTCAQLDRWEEKNKSDSETARWIKAHTKKCPKCLWPIEKDGGCNHMTCRRKECGHQFCWMCMQPWNNHTSCNAPTTDPALADAKAELERYLHYYERYANHAQSQQLEGKLRQQAADKVAQLVEGTDAEGKALPEGEGGGAGASGLTVLELQYIGDAAEALISCRRVLKNTYPVAYFMAAGPEKNLLEFLQANLETVTEELSGMLEADGVPERVAVLSKAADARQRLQHLAEGVEDGFRPQAAERMPSAGPSAS